jgi:chromosome segregation ATPase
MTITGGTGSMIQCGYCGNWHTHSYEMCKDIHNRPVAPSTGIVGLSNRIENAMDSIAEIQKLKADHLAALAEREEQALKWARIAGSNQKQINKLAGEVEALTAENEQIAALQADVQKWIKIAGENQKSANQSAKWAEDAELRIRELTALDKSMCIRLDAANTEIVALQAEVEQWKRIIVTHVDVIAEKDKEIHELKMEMNRMVRY